MSRLLRVRSSIGRWARGGVTLLCAWGCLRFSFVLSDTLFTHAEILWLFTSTLRSMEWSNAALWLAELPAGVESGSKSSKYSYVLERRLKFHFRFGNYQTGFRTRSCWASGMQTMRTEGWISIDSCFDMLLAESRLLLLTTLVVLWKGLNCMTVNNNEIIDYHSAANCWISFPASWDCKKRAALQRVTLY